MNRSLCVSSLLAAVVLCAGPALAQNSDKPAETVKPVKIEPGKGQPASATEATLKVGDKAPKISVDSWIKGDQVKSFENGKVYVVEFWATWCGPCIKSIPHLAELQKKHKDSVVVIGVAASERKPKEGEADNREANLKTFVGDPKNGMEYRVAYDSKRAMSDAWMKPAGQGGIPCAFIVDGEGKIAYIGHPTKMDEALEKAVKAAAKSGA